MDRSTRDGDEPPGADDRRNAALARFLIRAVDPAVDRRELLATLAREVAATLGDFCLILEPGEDGGIRIAAVAGGPGDVAARIEASHEGRTIPVPEGTPLAPGRTSMFDARTGFVPVVTEDMRPRRELAWRMLDLPPELTAAATSTISAPIVSRDLVLGRIQVDRLGGSDAYTEQDLELVQAIAAAAALVLQRHVIEDELARSLARFEALFVQAPVPLAYQIIGGGFRQNDALLDLFKRSSADLAESAYRDDAAFIPADAAEAWTTMRRHMTSGEPIHGLRMALLRADGTRREIDASVIAITGPTGTPIVTVFAANDLTDTLNLQSQLRHAQKMEALGRLAGGIAHDFNNVLMAIRGFAEFALEDARAGRPAVEDTEHVVAATRWAIELTGRLTAFARRDPIQLEHLDPAEAIYSMLPLIRRLAPESIRIVTDLEAAPTVLVDRAELEQTLVNLVVNAVDAMPQGGRLFIETRSAFLDEEHAAAHLATGPGLHAVIVVSDTGNGMDEHTRARIFEPFFTTKEIGRGTGLGLANVFSAVERAGGRITAYSELGRGTTFTIYLAAAAPDGAVASVQPIAEEAGPGGSESILVVEDEPLVGEFVVKALAARGYDVALASEPEAGIAMAATRRFDALVSDVVMPGMQGDAVAAAIRVSQPWIAVVFMSGYTARSLGFVVGAREALVHKPLSAAELARAVRTALDAA